jgi:hypothetical protein
MRVRFLPISVLISVSFVAVFCLALIHETRLGQVIIIGIISLIPCVWWHNKYGRRTEPTMPRGPKGEKRPADAGLR